MWGGGVLVHYGCRRIISRCCTLVVVEEIPPFYVKRFEYPEKRYINVTNYYYYYKYLPFLFFVNLKGFIIGKLVWLYCSDNLHKSKTNMTKNRDKIVIFLKNKIMILYFFHIAHPYLLACTYLNNAWDLVLRALLLSVCLFKINCFD